MVQQPAPLQIGCQNIWKHVHELSSGAEILYQTFEIVAIQGEQFEPLPKANRSSFFVLYGLSHVSTIVQTVQDSVPFQQALGQLLVGIILGGFITKF